MDLDIIDMRGGSVPFGERDPKPKAVPEYEPSHEEWLADQADLERIMEDREHYS